jgi:hydroxymethylbilane synthase
MRLRIASRRSDLARWQAVLVARVLERHEEKPSLEFIFKSSLGDQNLDLPLTSMGSKGVFTDDFYGDLVSGQCDLVVHSWKDLPVEDRESTHIAMTLPRADVRDVLLIPEAAWQGIRKTGRLNVFTSSPRRVYNLGACLSQLLPGAPEIEFHNIRGNVPTRLKKMHAAGYGLVAAKAGLDRLLAAEREGFLGGDAGVCALTKDCRFQVLPVSLNPPAPAQGALAVEVLRNNDRVNSIVGRFIDELSYACVQREREVLKTYGGGCHQKIGVAVLPRDYGQVFALKGVTSDGQVLNEWRLENSTAWVRARSLQHIFPFNVTDNSWFDRRPIALTEDLTSKRALFVARADALPDGFTSAADRILWTAGVQSWRKLARRGFWVNGCNDGLGEKEEPGLDHLTGGPLAWTKLTHASAGGEDDVLATYELCPKEEVPDLKGKTHFFWLSRTSFEAARKHYPQEIAAGHNACGPGVTYEYLRAQGGLRNQVKVFIGLDQFLAETSPQC